MSYSEVSTQDGCSHGENHATQMKPLCFVAQIDSRYATNLCQEGAILTLHSNRHHCNNSADIARPINNNDGLTLHKHQTRHKLHLLGFFWLAHLCLRDAAVMLVLLLPVLPLASQGRQAAKDMLWTCRKSLQRFFADA